MPRTTSRPENETKSNKVEHTEYYVDYSDHESVSDSEEEDLYRPLNDFYQEITEDN